MQHLVLAKLQFYCKVAEIAKENFSPGKEDICRGLPGTENRVEVKEWRRAEREG